MRGLNLPLALSATIQVHDPDPSLHRFSGRELLSAVLRLIRFALLAAPRPIGADYFLVKVTTHFESGCFSSISGPLDWPISKIS